MEQNKYKKYSSSEIESDGLNISLEFQGPDEDTLLLLSKKATKAVAQYILDRVQQDIPGILAVPNFYGEAEAYMESKKIPFSTKIREQYAEAIREDFMTSLPLSVQYREDDGIIYISPYVFSLEYGDFYRPALNFVSNCVNDWANNLTNKEIIDDSL